MYSVFFFSSHVIYGNADEYIIGSVSLKPYRTFVSLAVALGPSVMSLAMLCFFSPQDINHAGLN